MAHNKQTNDLKKWIHYEKTTFLEQPEQEIFLKKNEQPSAANLISFMEHQLVNA